MKATINAPSVQTTNTSNPVESLGSSGFVQPALIKKKELARRLSISPRTIDEWVRLRKIPHLQIGPRFYLYDFEAVLAALRKLYQVDAAV
jgi:excisionase family DNA binding protein